MKRRAFVMAFGAGPFAVPTRSEARAPARVGWVGGWYSPSAAATLLDAFRQGLRGHGYIEGQNLTIEDRWMEGNSADEAVRLTAQLVQSKVDILVALGQAVPGAKAAAGSLPLVFGFSGDPVAARLVGSLARPGANLTGFTLLAPDLAGKRVELLKEAAPRVLHLAALTNPLHPGEEQELRATQIAASRLGLTLQSFPVRSTGEVVAALEGMHRDQIDGVIALSNLLVMRERNAISKFAADYRIPTISGWEDFAIDGNLMSYGPNIERAWRDVAATYVDKVLNGTKAADLAVQQPREFQLVINQRTARALGLSLPTSLLTQASRVID